MAGLERIVVEPEKLISAAGNIESLTNALKADYEDLFRQVEDLTKVWNSEDARRYQKSMTEYRADFDALYKALTNSAESIRYAGKTYKNVQG